MKIRLALLSAIAALSGCVKPAALGGPDVDRIVGTYRADSCPDIEITRQELIAGHIRTRIKFIRIKLQPTIEADSDLQVSLGQKCSFARRKGPVYIFVRIRGQDASFDVPDLSLSHMLTYHKVRELPAG